MKLVFISILDCQDALGMESGAISDGNITASSIKSKNHLAHQGRLNFQASYSITGAWSADTNDANQWLQIDLGVDHTVTGVATQGRTDKPVWVDEYSIWYKPDSAQQGRSYTEKVQGEEVIKVKHIHPFPSWLE